MLVRALQRLLSKPSQRIYVVTGEQFRKFAEPPYSTDPRSYHFDVEDRQTESPAEFFPLPWDLAIGSERKKNPQIIKAFRIAPDAIDFAYCCNLESVVATVYDQRDGHWHKSDDQSGLDIEW